jgi:hypothetical protein
VTFFLLEFDNNENMFRFIYIEKLLFYYFVHNFD